MFRPAREVAAPPAGSHGVHRSGRRSTSARRKILKTSHILFGIEAFLFY
jgi:hypothetical protein